jgi:hypothetical protein
VVTTACRRSGRPSHVKRLAIPGADRKGGTANGAMCPTLIPVPEAGLLRQKPPHVEGCSRLSRIGTPDERQSGAVGEATLIISRRARRHSEEKLQSGEDA